MNASQNDMIADLMQRVEKTYLDRFDELDLKRKFHLGSRLYAWHGSDRYASILQDLRAQMVPDGHKARVSEILSTREELRYKDMEHDINHYATRKPFFDTYPNLLLLHNALFKIRHWLTVYGVDEREALNALLAADELSAMLDALTKDEQALTVLSTYAINTLYVYEKLYGHARVNLPALEALADNYNLSRPDDIELLIYLYTHCIICETNFYTARIPTNKMPNYQKMLSILETLIMQNFDYIHLDNKLEFLVSCKLVNMQSHAAVKIAKECLESMNSAGFLVDTVNSRPQQKRVTFLDSEHRNILFLMAFSDPVYCSKPVTL